MTNVNRRFASALTALAVMGSGAQILAAPAQAGDNIDQKNDAKISCTEAQAAVDKLALIHNSEPPRLRGESRFPSAG